MTPATRALTFALLTLCACGDKSGDEASDDTSADPSDSGAGPDDTAPDTVTGPEEDCSGVTTAAPTWTLLEPIAEYVSADVPYSYPGAINGFAGVAYGDGVFVATVSNINEDVFRWATSRDGYTWTTHTMPVPDGTLSYSVSAVSFQRGKFIAFGFTSGGKSYVMTSEGGGSWATTEVAPLNGLAGLASSDDLTVYAGGNNDLRTSPDLETWTSQAAGSGSFSYMDVEYGAGTFIATMNGGLNNAHSSTDGVTWAPIEDLPGLWTLAFGDGLWLAKSNWDDTLWSSTDGESFEQIADRTGWIGLGLMRYANGRFWGVGPYSQVMASADGVAWSEFGVVPAAEPAEGGTVTSYFMDQACGVCTCVVVGQYQDFTMGEEWLVDIYPLIAAGKVAAE